MKKTRKPRQHVASATKVAGTENPRNTLISASALRIAHTLSAIQSRNPASVLVPRHVSRANMDLIQATVLANRILERKAGRDKEILVGILGGPTAAVSPSRAQQHSRYYSPSALSSLGASRDGNIGELPCAEKGPGDLAIVHAAFQIDAENGYHDARLTRKGVEYVRSRRQVLAAFDDSLRSPRRLSSLDERSR